MLAHQGGWDEMLVAAGLVLAVMGLGRLRRRRAASADRRMAADAGHCAYCDEPLPAGADRCSSCGFRVAGER